MLTVSHTKEISESCAHTFSRCSRDPACAKLAGKIGSPMSPAPGGPRAAHAHTDHVGFAHAHTDPVGFAHAHTNPVGSAHGEAQLAGKIGSPMSPAPGGPRAAHAHHVSIFMINYMLTLTMMM